MKISRAHKLDDDDRINIQAGIYKGYTLAAIAQHLHVHRSTITRELQRNSKHELDTHPTCSKLVKCYICNNCAMKFHCRYHHVYYDHVYANQRAQQQLRLSRSHAYFPESIIQTIDPIVSEGVRNGQSLHHIFISNPELQQYCCERTIRRFIIRGLLSVKAHELRNYSKLQHKSSLVLDESPRDLRILYQRTFKDYHRYVNSHPNEQIVEFDSIIGKRTDHQAILTITFVPQNFQFGRVIRKGSAMSVNAKMRVLLRHLSESIIRQCFAICLCDNGSEFSSFTQLECNDQGEPLLHCFFTNPNTATDKARCERNHELARYCFTKYHSLNSVTQQQVDEAFSNINSYVRESKNDRTPYDLMKDRYGQAFLDALQIRRIPNKKVKLLPIV